MSNPANLLSLKPGRELVGLFSAILDVTHDAIIAIDGSQNILLFNQGASRIFGYDPAEVLGQSIDVLLPPAELETHSARARQFAESALQARQMGEAREVSGRRKDGTVFPAEASLTKASVDGQAIIAIIVRDLTARKQAEIMVKTGEENYRSLVENSESAIAVLDREGRILYANPPGVKIWNDPHIVGKTIFEVYPSDYAARYSLAIRQVIDTQTGIVDDVESLINGRLMWFRLSMSPLKNADGSVDKLLLNAFDLTERKQAETRVAQLTRLYATLSQVNQTIVRVRDRDTLYRTICEVAVQFGEFPLAWVGLLDEVSGDVRPVAASGLDVEQWPFPIFNTHQGEFKDGPVARAVRTARVVTSEDIQIDERTQGLHDQNREHGFHSLASVPFRLKGRTIGALSLVSPQVGLFEAEEEVRLLEEMGLDISFALDKMEDEERYRSTLDNMLEGCQIIDFDWRYVYVNQAVAGQGRATRDELLHHTMMEVYPGIEKTEMFAVLQDCMENRIARQMENKFTYPDGASGWFELSIQPVPEGIFVLSMDITGRKRAEDELRKSEERFRSLYENTTIGMYRTTPDGRILLANPALVAMLGYSSFEELARRNLEQAGFEPGHERRKYRQQIERDGTVRGHETAWTRKDGTAIFVRESAKAIRDVEGKIIYYEGTVEDITERKQAEEKLQTSERTLKLFVDYAPAAIAMFDRDMNYLAVSRRYLADYRLGDQDVIGRSHYDVFPEIPERWKQIHRRCLAGSIERVEEDPFPRADGTLDWVRWEIHPWYEKSGEIGGIILFSEVITARKLAEREIRQRTEDLILIKALNDAVNRGEDIEGIAKVFAHETRAVFDCQAVAIYLLSSDARYVEMPVSILPRNLAGKVEKLIGQPIPKIRIPLKENSFFKQLLANEQGTITNDPETLQRWIGEFAETTFLPAELRPVMKKLVPLIYKSLNIGSTVSIPLISSGRTIGLLDMSSQGQFTEEDLRRLRTIGHQVTLVLMRKQAEMQARLQLQRMKAVSEIDRAISSSMDMRVSLDVLLNEVISQLGVDAAAILILNGSTPVLEYFAGKGFRTLGIRRSQIHLGSDGVAGQVGRERRVIHIPNLAEAGQRFRRAELLRDEKFVEYFGLPLVAKGTLKGVLEAFHRSPLNPENEWLNFLETLAGQAAIAIDSAQTFEGLQRSNFNLSLAYDATIEGWSRAMDLRDKETEGHTQRVTEMTVRLAEKWGLSQRELVHIRRGALLHDIGKLGVPDHILLKPGKLTEEEWVIMRQHPQFAYDMLASIDYLRPALDIPYCHHEKWDGTGYPRQLEGTRIPIAARLFAVVDVWDALHSDRPYRKAWPQEEVLEYIRSGSGAHFDPQVVELFLKLAS